jgi:hypothetical protein
VYEYLAEKLLPSADGGYFADSTPPQTYPSMSEAINRHASSGWVLDRFEVGTGEVWLIFRREAA